jgi:hypothetical protein
MRFRDHVQSYFFKPCTEGVAHHAPERAWQGSLNGQILTTQTDSGGGMHGAEPGVRWQATGYAVWIRAASP